MFFQKFFKAKNKIFQRWKFFLKICLSQKYYKNFLVVRFEKYFLIIPEDWTLFFKIYEGQKVSSKISRGLEIFLRMQPKVKNFFQKFLKPGFLFKKNFTDLNFLYTWLKIFFKHFLMSVKLPKNMSQVQIFLEKFPQIRNFFLKICQS